MLRLKAAGSVELSVAGDKGGYTMQNPGAQKPFLQRVRGITGALERKGQGTVVNPEP